MGRRVQISASASVKLNAPRDCFGRAEQTGGTRHSHGFITMLEERAPAGELLHKRVNCGS